MCATPSVEAWARVGGREGVVDVDVAVLGQRTREVRVVLLLARGGSACSRAVRTSPFCSLATASRAGSPTQSSAKPTSRPNASPSAPTTWRRLSLSTRLPFGRPKCASRITRPRLSAISRMVGATRSMRVASLTRPSSTGTLRSTRSRTRLPRGSASSRVRKALVWAAMAGTPIGKRGTGGTRRTIGAARAGRPDGAASDQARHVDRRVGHAIGEAPLVCRTTTGRAPWCLRAPWSGPCGRSTSADRG